MHGQIERRRRLKVPLPMKGLGRFWLLVLGRGTMPLTLTASVSQTIAFFTLSHAPFHIHVNFCTGFFRLVHASHTQQNSPVYIYPIRANIASLADRTIAAPQNRKTISLA